MPLFRSSCVTPQVRLVNKGTDKWRCASCHSKQCTLRRAFGRWPSASFTAMDDSQRMAFWTSLDNLIGKDMVYKANERLDQFESHAEKYHDNLQANLPPWYHSGS